MATAVDIGASDRTALVKPGSHVSVLNKTPPSHGKSVAIFVSRKEFEVQD